MMRKSLLVAFLAMLSGFWMEMSTVRAEPAFARVEVLKTVRLYEHGPEGFFAGVTVKSFLALNLFEGLSPTLMTGVTLGDHHINLTLLGGVVLMPGMKNVAITGLTLEGEYRRLLVDGEVFFLPEVARFEAELNALISVYKERVAVGVGGATVGEILNYDRIGYGGGPAIKLRLLEGAVKIHLLAAVHFGKYPNEQHPESLDWKLPRIKVVVDF